MNISYLGGDRFEIKSGQVAIRLGAKVSIDGFELPGPGEYERSGVSLIGIPDGDNIIYIIKAEEIKICYLGRIVRDLPEDEIKEIGDIDILFLPLGQGGILPAKKALSLVTKIDPKIVTPMLFADLTEFKKIEGVDDGEIDSLKIKKSELPEEERRIVILKVK